MSSFWPDLTTAFFRVLGPPFILLLTLVLFLASFGKSLGVRRLYVRTLVKIFEVRDRVCTFASDLYRCNIIT